MKNLLLLFLASMALTTINAENFNWANKTGGTGQDAGRGIAADTAGNSYIVGTFQGNIDLNPGPGTINVSSWGLLDFFIQKLDTAGNLISYGHIGSTGTDYASEVRLDSLGNIYIWNCLFNCVYSTNGLFCIKA
jgi:hypothetical protein